MNGAWNCFFSSSLPLCLAVLRVRLATSTFVLELRQSRNDGASGVPRQLGDSQKIVQKLLRVPPHSCLRLYTVETLRQFFEQRLGPVQYLCRHIYRVRRRPLNDNLARDLRLPAVR